ncbi:MAG TPA: class I SAM-dependent methyltransferase [Halothiobacillus sp.]|nr:class I SAM-dependent methyltransferase [Halothiobacillus sp.]
MQTEEPYWLEEAYSSALAAQDIGTINRAINGSRVVESVIAAAFNPNAKFIDWGGGYGVFTRLMRDKGYDFYWNDLHCKNLFAEQFTANLDEQYELMTSFEVFEHISDPLKEIGNMIKISPNILFSTEILQSSLINLPDWWYLGLHHGQHISFYSIRSLEIIAAKFGLHFVTDGRSLHLLSKNPISAITFKVIARDGMVGRVISRLGRLKLRNKSLIAHDYSRSVHEA